MINTSNRFVGIGEHFFFLIKFAFNLLLDCTNYVLLKLIEFADSCHILLVVFDAYILNCCFDASCG